jgi:biopolymer transport protein ExbB
MAEGIYIALITTIAGLAVAIIILPLYSLINSKIETELDKIEIAKKMTNWRTAEMRIKINADVEKAITALKESDGILEVKEVPDDKNANIWISLNPHMLEKSIGNIIKEKCNAEARIVESKLKQ